MSDAPELNDPSSWGVSLANVAEVMLPCLDAVEARTVAEIGAYAGDLTLFLLDWARAAGATVTAIDPYPQDALVRLDAARDDLELMRRTSLDALAEIALPDAIVIDGDHNWWTVTEELRAIADRVEGPELPLLLFHDVCWPHARRDDYYAPDDIPAEYRRPMAGEGADRGVFPGEPGLRAGGLPYKRSADREGGARNGVRTAVEDFVAVREHLRFAVVPAFFGLGVVWDRRAPWADAVAAVIDPYDEHPVVARLEANRVHHLAESHARLTELWSARERLAEQEEVLRRLLDSSAFRLAERLSRLRDRAGVGRGVSVVSRAAVRRALGDD